MIRLSEAAPSAELRGHALKLKFPSALHPQAVLASTSLGVSLVVLSERGVLHAVQLPHTSHVALGESVLCHFLAPETTPGGLNGIASVPLQVNFYVREFKDGWRDVLPPLWSQG